jgi:acetyl-CoA acyltransferase
MRTKVSRRAFGAGVLTAGIVGKAASLLKREGGKYALATQCIGGGQGIATVLEAV